MLEKNQQADRTGCRLAEGFSFWEKVWAQVSFFALGIAGTAGIIRADWPWVLPFLILYAYGVLGVVVRHLACPRCPHLYVYNDCLQAHPAVTRLFIKKQKQTPMSRKEKVLFIIIFLGIALYPLYWLRSQPVLLAVFLASMFAWYGGQFLYFCKRCRVKSCPFNRVPG